MVDPSFEYRPGTVIPGTQYKVIRRIGAGGMGTVYEVDDVSVEKRYVLKTIHPRLASREDAVERFVREAKALAKLEHRNIVQVMTAGVTTDAHKLRFFVMEKLNGHALRTVLDKKGCLDLEAAIRSMIELLSALEKAHEVGIIHRDIKPENIFIHRDSNGITTLKVIDFGIMTSSSAPTVNRQGFVGTLRYASPEQIENIDVAPATDLYAATLVFYECLTGRGPFDDVTDFNEMIRAHMERAPPPPSYFRPEVPKAIDALIARGLAKSPADRIADAFTYAAELNRIRREMRGEIVNVSQLATTPDVLQSSETTSGQVAHATTVAAPDPTRASPGAPRSVDPALDGRPAPHGASSAPTPRMDRDPHGHAGGASSGPKAVGGVTAAFPPPVMSLGPAPMAAAGAPVDRGAPTATSAPLGAADMGRRGDTVRLSTAEHMALQPDVPLVATKTERLEPVPGAFLPTDPPLPLLPGAGADRRTFNSSLDVQQLLVTNGGRAPAKPAARRSIVAFLVGGVILLVAAIAGGAVLVKSRASKAPPATVQALAPASAAPPVAARPGDAVASAPVDAAPALAASSPTPPAAPPPAPPDSTPPKPSATRHTAPHRSDDRRPTPSPAPAPTGKRRIPSSGL